MNESIQISLFDFPWTVQFVPKNHEELNDGTDGRTLYNERIILVRGDLDPVVLKEVLIHELTHATLCAQGRVYQAKFGLEDLCEFMGYCGPGIIGIANQIFDALISSRQPKPEPEPAPEEPKAKEPKKQ